MMYIGWTYSALYISIYLKLTMMYIDVHYWISSSHTHSDVVGVRRTLCPLSNAGGNEVKLMMNMALSGFEPVTQ